MNFLTDKAYQSEISTNQSTSSMLVNPIVNLCNSPFGRLTKSPILTRRLNSNSTNNNNNNSDLNTYKLKIENSSNLENEISHSPVTDNSNSGVCATSTSIYNSFKSMIGLNSSNANSYLKKNDSLTSVTSSETLCATATDSTAQFIDPFELKNRFLEISSKFLVILLDCRTYTDFSSKHIKDSVHLNCRDKLTRKRLQSRKLTVKDLISCEEVKSKFESNNLPVGGVDISHEISKLTSSKQPQQQHFCSNLNEQEYLEASCCNNNNNDNIIVLYDDTTSELTDLQSESNPLKIVQENIKQSGYKKECKILKGGFKLFAEIFPEFCVLKENNNQNHKIREQFYEPDLRQSDIDNALMTQILPFLYLGNECDAKNIKKLEENDIYYILNVTKNIPFYSSQTTNKKFTCKRIAVNDNENQNLKDHFEEAFDFIDEAKKNNLKVLVHCQAGISRSPTIIIAYLMKKLNFKFNDAYNRVREYRPIIAPNLIFMSQLMDYETKIASENLNKNNSLLLKKSNSPDLVEDSSSSSNSSSMSSSSSSSSSSATIDSNDANNRFFNFNSITKEKSKSILVN